jgi:hypothetical protein
MKSSKTIDSAAGNARKRVENQADRRARLASYAIERGHAQTLRRHLLEGLDPGAQFFYRGVGFFGDRLIGEAALLGEVECVKTLEEAGAQMTDEEILRVFRPENNQQMVTYLLATQKFDPAGLMRSGRPWADRIAELPPKSLRNCVRAISEWESEMLACSSPPSRSQGRSNFL